MSQTRTRPVGSGSLRPTLSVPKLAVQQVGKVFRRQGKDQVCLQDVNLQVNRNELTCIVGASGCGKSTLLNIVAGLIPASSGQVLVDGNVVPGPGPDRGMVFQGYTLYPWLTVAGNVGFGLKFRNISREDRAQRVAHYLGIVGLSNFADAYPKQLSGGMKQRVAIARALANEPEVILMDEPFGALDAQTKSQMQQFLLQLWERTHTTILMITHDVEEAIFLSQRVYVMGTNPGRIKHEISIPLPEHRETELKMTLGFMEIKRQVLTALEA